MRQYLGTSRAGDIQKAKTERDSAEEKIKEFILRMVGSIVDRGDEVSVNVIKGYSVSIFELHVAKNDLGKVIGKKGRIADALRTLVVAYSSKLKQQAVIEIVE